MNFLIIQKDGEHKENFYFREKYALKYALEQSGHKVVFTDSLEHYDFIFIIEQYDNSILNNQSFNYVTLLIKKENPKLKIIQWIIDLHYGDQRRYHNISSISDIILHSTRSLIPEYQKLFPNKKHVWFPNGIDSQFFHQNHFIQLINPYNIAFVGSPNQKRDLFIEKLKEKDIFVQKRFERGINMINTINCSKIHFNQSIANDINYRNFETIGLGVCLLTNKVDDMEELGFEHRKNCFLYNSFDECVDLYNEIIQNELWYTKWKKKLDLKQFQENNSYIARIKNILMKEI